jgi:hypothetical protein
MFTGSRRAEQLSLHSQQRVVDTVEDSVLRTEMADIESQEEDVPKRILFFKTMSWLGQIRSHCRDETWSASLWQTFLSASMGAQIPVIAEKPQGTQLERLIKLLTFFVRHIRLKHSRWLKPEVSIVETLS